MDHHEHIEIPPEDVHAMLQRGEDVLLLDCRRREEYDLVHLPGATLIPMDEIAARAEELRPYADRRIIVYCHHGRRSLNVAHALRRHGLTGAESMTGGIDEWSRRIDPSLPRY